MTRKLCDQPLDLLERRFQALQERAASLPEASRQELETALQELSQAIAALRAAGRPAGQGPGPPAASRAPGRCDTILQHVFDAIPDLLTVIDRDFNIIMSNWHGSRVVPEAARQASPSATGFTITGTAPARPAMSWRSSPPANLRRLEKINPYRRPGPGSSALFPSWMNPGR